MTAVSCTPTQLLRLVFLVVALVCSECFVDMTPTDPASRQPTSGQAHLTVPAHHFERVLIIVLENQNYKDAIGDTYLGFLAKQGASFTNFHGLFHPSYPNYLAMVSGKGIRTFHDHQRDMSDKTIADLLKPEGLTWKNYAEGYPGQCFKGNRSNLYVRKHVPFMSFIQIQQHECENIVPSTQLVEDLKTDSLPNYMFYSPNLDNDGHDTGLQYASKWLKGFLEPLRQNQAFMKGTLIIVTFDESGSNGQRDTNHIYTVFLGDMVKPGEHAENYNHYNVLRTIEENFGLGALADGDGGAKLITDVWK